MPEMHQKSIEKGHSLERAVSLIQEAILKADPQLQGAEFSIERNKTFVIDGVRHEVDVWVETHPKSHYHSSFLFECKNWQSPVGKNEVIILSEKVKVLGASRGFLVARQLTKHAEAQKALDPRIEIIECASEFACPLDFKLVHAVHGPLNISMSVINWVISGAGPAPLLDWKNALCYFNNELTDFRRFIDARMHGLFREYEKRNPTMCQKHRNHFGEFAWQFFFEPGTLTVGEVNVAILELGTKFFANYHNLKLISKFELKGHGRAFSYEVADPIEEGLSLQVDIVQRIR